MKVHWAAGGMTASASGVLGRSVSFLFGFLVTGLVYGKLGEGHGVVDLSWEGSFEFFAKGNHFSDQGCAGSTEKLRLVVVLHEGSGFSVVDPVGESSVAERCFHGLGANCTGSCGGDPFGDALDDVIRGVFG